MAPAAPPSRPETLKLLGEVMNDYSGSSGLGCGHVGRGRGFRPRPTGLHAGHCVLLGAAYCWVLLTAGAAYCWGVTYCRSFRMAWGAELAWASTEVAAWVRICDWVILVTSLARSASVRFDREAVTLVIAVCRLDTV